MCDAGWKGADCSVSPITLGKGDYYKRDIYGPTWTSISIPASDTPVHIKTGAPADVYVKLGADSDPNEFSFDF